MKKIYTYNLYLFLIRLIGIFFYWPFILSLFKLSPHAELAIWGSFCSSAFYLVLLTAIYSVVDNAKGDFTSNEFILRKLNGWKWVLISISIALFIISFAIEIQAFSSREFPDANHKILYVLKVFGPRLLNTNMAFILVSFAVFYLSNLLQEQKRLKDEQALTI